MTAGVFLSGCVAAFLTLAIFSFLFKDNPVYKFAEHIFIGVGTGYYVVIAYKDVFIPKVWDQVRANEPGAWLRVAAALLGAAMLFHLWPRASWIARLPIAFLVGAYAGLRLVGTMQADVIGQVDDLMASVRGAELPAFALREESVIGDVLIVVGVLAVLLHFFFSAERGPVLGAMSKVGVVFLMITFGAAFGSTVPNRVSLLLGRARKLEGYGWATAVAAVVVVGLIVAGEVWRRRRGRGGAG
jgi:hypothetical protein